MTPRRLLTFGGLAIAVGVLGGWLVVRPPRWFKRPATNLSAANVPAEPSAGRKIKARVFYVADEGGRLTSVERDVAFGEGTAAQARQLIEAQLAPVDEPLVSAVPPGTTLRALFVTERGEAYVDLSHDIVGGHSGGSMNELLTVYTLVDVLTSNLPAVTSVQLLVDGKEVETLAGHVDLRRPLAKNLEWAIERENVEVKSEK